MSILLRTRKRSRNGLNNNESGENMTIASYSFNSPWEEGERYAGNIAYGRCVWQLFSLGS